ncbi:transforming growth factor-beta-induced protein ig-h3 [Onthophagus taurus]|uniref:transforming growth factor-beta-induced protein ig-h3 n=1 Tax=Onthophagus taurus TaxID=166361 RepID=UPI000C1FE170|nr:periostin [Onthophagus taurus]
MGSRAIVFSFLLLFFLQVNGQILDFAAAGDPFGGSFWPFGSHFNFFRPAPQPWWKGPNVCIERRQIGKDTENETRSTENVDPDAIANHFEAALTFSSCIETPDKYECTTKTNVHGDEKTHNVRYKCCHGYVKSRRQQICILQEEMKPLMEVFDKYNGSNFKNLVKDVNFDEKFAKTNYTVFLPQDSSLDKYVEQLSDMNQIEVTKRESSNSANEMILNHIIPGIIDLNDYSNEDILYTENNNSTIRLNFYPTPNGGKLVTANCVRIPKANIFASNGMVHLVDTAIESPKSTIQEIIDQNPKFSTFKSALEASDLQGILKEPGQHTVYLPTNEAFDALDETTKEKILTGKGCAATILKHHLTTHTVCTAAVIQNATVHDMDIDIINMERKNDEVFIDGKAKIIEGDILATDGVIHSLDKLIIPNTALEINDVLSNKNLSKFQEIVSKAGLTETLQNLKDATFFVPFDEAFAEPEAQNYLEKIQDDPEKLKELVLYHIVKGEMQVDDMVETSLVPTNVEGKQLRVKVFPFFSNIFLKTLSPPPMVQCATLTRVEEKACGAVVHEIDKVLVPPTQNLLEILDNDPRLSTFRSLLTGTKLEEKLQDANETLTVLAVTNYAFGKYKYDLEALRENKTLADNVLKRHVIKRPVCCQELSYGDQIFNRWSTFGDPFQTGNSQVIKDCDKIATNGILHTVSAFMYRHQ